MLDPLTVDLIRESPWNPRVWSEAAHVGTRGIGQKCADRETIPLCGYHHRTGPDSHHVLGKTFWTHRGLNRTELIRELNERYEQEIVSCT